MRYALTQEMIQYIVSTNESSADKQMHESHVMISPHLIIVPIVNTTKRNIILLCLFVLLSWSTPGYANDARLSFAPADTENPFNLSLIIDHAAQIAGMKVTITYDKNLLTFINAEKSSATSSFMHVVNDKMPGKLIIVMASAKGISGDKIPLFHLEFTKSQNTDKQKLTIAIVQIQLMDENLKEIQANYPEYTF